MIFFTFMLKERGLCSIQEPCLLTKHDSALKNNNSLPTPVADPDLELGGGGGGLDLLAMAAIFLTLISSFFTENNGGGGGGARAPPLDPPLILCTKNSRR